MIEGKSLKDKWIVITRPSHQVEKLKLKLKAVGARTILFPLIEITPPKDVALIEEQLSSLQDYDLAIFVSANAVEYSFKWINLSQHLSQLQTVKIATTGKKTAESLKTKGVKIDFCPEQIFNSEALLAEPGFKKFCEGKKIAIIRGEGGRDFLHDRLLQLNAAVDYFNVYQRACPQSSLDVLKCHQQCDELDAILLTSGTSVDNFFKLANTESWINDLTLILGSPRMQKKIPKSFQGKLLIAKDPSDETLFEKLVTNFNKPHF